MAHLDGMVAREMMAHAMKLPTSSDRWPRCKFTNTSLRACLIALIAGGADAGQKAAIGKRCSDLVKQVSSNTHHKFLDTSTLRQLLRTQGWPAMPASSWDFIDRRVWASLEEVSVDVIPPPRPAGPFDNAALCTRCRLPAPPEPPHPPDGNQDTQPDQVEAGEGSYNVAEAEREAPNRRLRGRPSKSST